MLKSAHQLELTGNRILVKEAKGVDEITNSGIVSTTKDQQTAFLFSEVTRVGPDVTKVFPGDIIMHSIRQGTLVRIGAEYQALISEPEIVAVVNLTAQDIQ